MAKLPVLVASVRLIVYSVLSIVIINRLKVDAADGETFLMFIVAMAAVFELIGTAFGQGDNGIDAVCQTFAFLLVASVEIAIIAGATFAVRSSEQFVKGGAFQPVGYTFSAIALFIGLVTTLVLLFRWRK